MWNVYVYIYITEMGEQKHILVLQNYICIKYGSLLFKKEKKYSFS